MTAYMKTGRPIRPDKGKVTEGQGRAAAGGCLAEEEIGRRSGLDGVRPPVPPTKE